jgi:hypothetical protein
MSAATRRRRCISRGSSPSSAPLIAARPAKHNQDALAVGELEEVLGLELAFEMDCAKAHVVEEASLVAEARGVLVESLDDQLCLVSGDQLHAFLLHRIRSTSIHRHAATSPDRSAPLPQGAE